MKLELTAQELQVILAALEDLPLKVSLSTYQNIYKQAAEAGIIKTPEQPKAPEGE